MDGDLGNRIDGERPIESQMPPRPAFQKPLRAELENRYRYHAPKGDQAQRYESIRAKILDTALHVVELTPCCPEQTRALNALDEAMFLANAAIARRE